MYLMYKYHSKHNKAEREYNNLLLTKTEDPYYLWSITIFLNNTSFII